MDRQRPAARKGVSRAAVEGHGANGPILIQRHRSARARGPEVSALSRSCRVNRPRPNGRPATAPRPPLPGASALPLIGDRVVAQYHGPQRSAGGNEHAGEALRRRNRLRVAIPESARSAAGRQSARRGKHCEAVCRRRGETGNNIDDEIPRERGRAVDLHLVVFAQTRVLEGGRCGGSTEVNGERTRRRLCVAADNRR